MALDKKIEDILREAAEAVAAADVPEDLRSVAFKEAVAHLRGDSASEDAVGTTGKNKRTTTHKKASTEKASQTAAAKGGASSDVSVPDQPTFFSRLADESGVGERDLQDILQLTVDGRVLVTPPTRKLGATVAEQARTVIALVSGGRAIGLEERPVNAEAVRQEANRKRCYQSNNFAFRHLGQMEGFNAGSNRNEIVLTSKWIAEFEAAVDQTQSRAAAKTDAPD